jgi:hypothetical protein
MNKFAILMFGLAGVGMVGCAVDSSAVDDSEQSSATAQAEIATAPDGVTPNTFGSGHVIRLANTNLCLQPQGGSTGFVPTELVTCSFSTPVQNWIQKPVSGGTELVNAVSHLCLWAFGDVATTGTGIGVIGCDADGTTTPASNALWSLSTSAGIATLQSRLGHRLTGFCLDHQPGGQQLSVCDSRVSEKWGVGQQ